MFLILPAEVEEIIELIGIRYNIETLNKYLSVQGFFSKVYLVDLSPSLCEVARERFSRLGWKNVEVACVDARVFRLEEKVDWVSMSYSLSMIPEYIPSLLLAPCSQRLSR